MDSTLTAEGIQGVQNAGLFALPANAGFDPLKPWRLEILVNGAGAPPVTVAFGLDYKVPDAQALASLGDDRERRARAAAVDQSGVADARTAISLPLDSEPPPVPAWVEAWRDGRVNVAILAALLSVLTLIFIFQATLARSRLAHRLVRNGFLLVVLVWLGWTAGVQLSIVNVINYLKAPFSGVDIGFYLAEPLMVMIAAYTLVSRGADRARRVLRLAVPVRGASGTARPVVARPRRAAMESRRPRWRSACGWASTSRPPPCWSLVLTAIDPSGAAHRDRAVQDGDHLEIHPRLALCALCRCACWRSGCSPSGPIAASCVRSAACSRSSTGCTSSICSSAVPNAAIPAICANGRARCGRSRRPARSSRPSAFSASIARSNITTTSAARRWCRPPSSRGEPRPAVVVAENA